MASRPYSLGHMSPSDITGDDSAVDMKISDWEYTDHNDTAINGRVGGYCALSGSRR